MWDIEGRKLSIISLSCYVCAHLCGQIGRQQQQQQQQDCLLTEGPLIPAGPFNPAGPAGPGCPAGPISPA